jgi:hypothetical protein
MERVAKVESLQEILADMTTNDGGNGVPGITLY